MSSDLTLSADDRWSSDLIESADQLINRYDQLIKKCEKIPTLQISISIPSVSYIYFLL